MFKTLLPLIASFLLHFALDAQTSSQSSSNAADKKTTEAQVREHGADASIAQTNENLNTTILQQMRNITQKLSKCVQGSDQYAFHAKELSELSAKYPKEAKWVAQQFEQEKANKTLSPAAYDNWKQQQHPPKN